MEYRFKINLDIANNEAKGDYFTPNKLDAILSKANGADLFIDINSFGGCVPSGLSMFATLRRYANENNATIATRSDGFVASIATVIFLAGDRRIVNEFMQPFVHDPYFPNYQASTSQELRESAQYLDDAKLLIARFYAKNTFLNVEDALDLMANNTWMSAEECLAVGFATEIEELSNSGLKIAAKLKTK